MVEPTPKRIILRESSVRDRVPVHPVTLYRWEQKGQFPRRVRLGPNSVGWYEHEIEEWLANRPGGGRVVASPNAAA